MRKAINWAIDLGLVLLAYLWLTEGMEQAGNVYLFLMWAFGIGGVCAAFGEQAEAKPRRWVATGLWIGHMVLMAATGRFVLAGVLMFVLAVSEANRQAAEKRAKA